VNFERNLRRVMYVDWLVSEQVERIVDAMRSEAASADQAARRMSPADVFNTLPSPSGGR
jgi:hypothetical protein